MTRSYLVITSQALCQDGGPITIEHFSDMTKFTLWSEARRHGFKVRGSDDFNIGVVEGGKLIDLLWMEKSIGETAESLAEIAEEIGL